MDKIDIQKTQSTPLVSFDPGSGIFKMEGRSIPENPGDFFDPLLSWLNEYFENPAPKTNFDVNLDYVNRIPTSTVRLIRRIVRDNQFRAYSARQTIAQWASVRSGEEKHIFPFQEEADIMFNSALVYEMAVLKGYVEPLLKQIEDTEEVYTEAKRLLHFTANFVYISPDHVPFTSILREFIGGSGFRY